ncbi:MAG: response regulator [Nitrospirae bacterium]|nr:response regulator [Nitrospirota bacterium]
MKHILVIDDDPVMRSLLKSFLSLRKFRVDCVNTEADAMKVLINDHVDIVITDIKMPGTDSVSLIRKINQTKPGVKLIMMSGDSSFDKLPKDIRADMPFIHKPFKLQDIEKLIRTLTGTANA